MLPRLLWITLLLATAPLAVPYFIQLWDLPHYQYFPALLVALIVLTWSRWDGQWRLPQNWLSWALVTGGAVALLNGALYWSPWMGAVGLVLLLGAFFRSHQSVPASRWGLLHLWPSSWMLIRLPLNFDYQLTGWLQSSTAVVSSHVLDRLDVTHRLSGNVFTLPSGTLFVEAACSGVQSVFSLLFCAVLLVAWHRRSPVLLPVYALAAMLWAAIMNIVRVITIALAQEWMSIDLAHGWQHELLGYICLAIAILLLLSTDRTLRVIFYPVPDEMESIRVNPLREWWNHRFVGMKGIEALPVLQSNDDWPQRRRTVHWSLWSQRLSIVAIPLVILGVFVPQVVAAVRHFTEVIQPNQTDYWSPSQELLANLPGITVLSYETAKDSSNPTLGVHAHMWVVNINGIVGRVLASQHNDVHDLCNCYRANGWRIKQRQLITVDDWDMIKADWINGDSVFGSLFFSTLDSHARPVKLSNWSLGDMMRFRFSDRDSPEQVSYNGLSVNVQLWTTSETPFTTEQIEALRQANIKIRQVIRQDLAAAKATR